MSTPANKGLIRYIQILKSTLLSDNNIQHRHYLKINIHISLNAESISHQHEQALVS